MFVINILQTLKDYSDVFGYCDKLIGGGTYMDDTVATFYLPFIGWMFAVLSTLLSGLTFCFACIQIAPSFYYYQKVGQVNV